MLLALAEYEASLDENGLPRDQTMTILADPENPKGTHSWRARAVRNWATHALELEMARPEHTGDNYARARKFVLERVERQPPQARQ